jgi:hypothetical protein
MKKFFGLAQRHNNDVDEDLTDAVDKTTKALKKSDEVAKKARR